MFQVSTGFDHGLNAPIGLVGTATLAGPKTGLLGLLGRGKEAHVFTTRPPGRTMGKAIDPRAANRIVERRGQVVATFAHGLPACRFIQTHHCAIVVDWVR
jgi:hypothetical protein